MLLFMVIYQYVVYYLNQVHNYLVEIMKDVTFFFMLLLVKHIMLQNI